MKISEIRKVYFILSGIILIVIALFAYMWFDTQRLAGKFSSKSESVTEAKTNMATNVVESTNTETGQADSLKSSNSEVDGSTSEQNQNKTEDASKDDKSAIETAKDTKTVKTDDWMFEKGEDIEGKKTNVDKSNTTSE